MTQGIHTGEAVEAFYKSEGISGLIPGSHAELLRNYPSLAFSDSKFSIFDISRLAISKTISYLLTISKWFRYQYRLSTVRRYQ